MSDRNRYTDAYRIAGSLEVIGVIVKVVGYLLAAIICIAGIVISSKLNEVSRYSSDGAMASGVVMLLYLVGGGLQGFLFWVGGVLICGMGQLVRCTADTAVNTAETAAATRSAAAPHAATP
ncbi:MAG: hypothetical protein NT029_12860 [Armatimonadetes bacterium]|nr:hypothetical protein [Armatimonadota bacterium]